MSQGNFMKVVDTLEKYQQRMVNTKSEAGKEFILFKRQLYQMYEVQNRSIDEHETFSLTLERQNIRWLYQANLDYIGEMQRVNYLDSLVEHGALKGSVFKMKMLSASRLRGIGAFSLAGLTYAKLSALSLMVGPVIPMAGIVGAALYGARSLVETDMISRIDFVTEGEFKGQLRATVQKSPFVSYTIIMNPKWTKSICALGDDDMGADDTDANILQADEYMDESTGEFKRHGVFRIPADANRDKITMEWIMAVKDEDSETDALFNDQIIYRHAKIAATGGLTGLRKMTAQSTGYANFGDEEELAEHLKHQTDAADDTLAAMSQHFG